jgi:hypothetical protein
MSVINVYHPRGAHTIRPVDRTGHDKPSGNKPSSPQTNPPPNPANHLEQPFEKEMHRSKPLAQNFDDDAAESVLHGQFDRKLSEYATRAVAVYQLHAEINHRQHIQSLLGIDEYA